MGVELIAALPMYDWPEVRSETDALWNRLRDELRSLGVMAPEHLARTRRDVPRAQGGNDEERGMIEVSDPASLHEVDLHELWRHPNLLLAQTCWGPMELGLADHVQVVGQPKYDGIAGGEGEFYSSALVMRACEADAVPPPPDGRANVPLERLRDRRFIYNDTSSMSGYLALAADLRAMGESYRLFSYLGQSGSHRGSIIAVAQGTADVAAVDCRSFAMARRFEPAARDVEVVGWTTRRKGLPLITSRRTSPSVAVVLRDVLSTFDWRIAG